MIDTYNSLAEKTELVDALPPGGLKDKYKNQLDEMLNDPSTQMAIGMGSSIRNALEYLSPDFEEMMKDADLGDSPLQDVGKAFDPAFFKIAKYADKLMPYQKMTGEG